MVTSVFLSGSRGGLLALLLELAFIAVLWMRQNRTKPVALAGVSLTLLTVGLLAAMAPPVATNHMLSLRDASRLLIYRDSINMFLAHPLLGSGLGTFSAVFPHYRVFYDGFITNHAHNDYLEQLLDTGLVGLAIAAWFVVELFRHGLRNVFGRQSTPSARISTAALAACTGFLFHSFTDFNLHIPANAALFYVVCAIAAVPALNGPIARKTQALRASTKEASGEKHSSANWGSEKGTLQVKRVA
jgi:O-antigen ligase